MRPETVWQARIMRRANIARHIGELASMAFYLNGRSILAQRTAAAVIQARVLGTPS